MIKNHIIYNMFSDYQFKMTKASGCHIWDDKNNKLIDFTSGWNVANLGWNNKEIQQAIIAQAKKNIYSSMWLADSIQEQYAELLTKSLPKSLTCITREVAGVNANIMAIKTARAYTGKRKIVSFRDNFHGSLYHALQLGYAPDYAVAKAIFLNFDHHIQLTFPKVKYQDKDEKKILINFKKQLEQTLRKDNDIAAIVTECGIVTGWGSTNIAPVGFLSTIREITKKYGVLLIVDEVGTGFSRCGKLFGIQIENIIPDIVTFAKGMANGAIMAATVTSKEIAEATYQKSNPQSTFAWGPLNVAAALKTLQIHLRDKVWLKSQQDGQYALQILRSELINHSLVTDINGKGLEIGVHLIQDNKINMKQLINKSRNLGLHLAYADDYSFQLMPPLTIEKKTLDQGLEIFIKLIKSL